MAFTRSKIVSAVPLAALLQLDNAARRGRSGARAYGIAIF